MTGTPNAVHASARPFTDWWNVQNTSGFSGLPKFRQSVMAAGRPPEHATLRAASANAICAPA
jgi:hypothetical protein